MRARIIITHACTSQAHAVVTIATRIDNNKEMDEDTDRGLPEMVMEKSGRFEVVDLQRELMSKDQDSTGTLHTDTTTKESAQDENQLDSKQPSLQESQTEGYSTSLYEDVQHQHHEHVPEPHLPQSTDLKSATLATEEQTVPLAPLQGDQKKPANVKSQPNDTITIDNTSGVKHAQPIFLRSQQRSDVKSMKQIRMQSAPGSRLAQSVHHQHETKDEEMEKKRALNEAAFDAWVSRKNSERRKSARARLKTESTEEEKQKKKEMCETVYQNWLEVKNKQWREQRVLSRPSTSVPKKDEETCRQAFETWMKRKQNQHHDEVKKNQMKARELAEAAEKADTSVIERSYKQWLQQKKVQAKEEAVKKEHYRRLYFSQPKKLKEHTLDSVCFTTKINDSSKTREKKSQKFDGF